MKTMDLKIVTFICVIFFAGCASVQKDYEHMATKEYQKKPQLRQSLFSTSEPLSETAVQKILSSKVVLPKTIHLAVVRLSDTTDGLDFQMIDQEIAEKIYNRTLWGPRVQSIIPVPQVMITKPANLASLRQAAVLLQADALLIIKPISHTDWRYLWLEEDKAKAITSLEVILLDTRTSVVPYTALMTETAEIQREKSDFSHREVTMRAKNASETKALLQIPAAVQKFISQSM